MSPLYDLILQRKGELQTETVKTHVVNAKDKLGAADRTQLAVMALLYGLIDPLG